MAITHYKPGLLTRRPRRLTTFVSLLWLNLAMLPCTMAATGEQHAGDPGKPAAAGSAHHGHMQGHSATAGHDQHSAGSLHAEHALMDHPCMVGDDCCELDDVLFGDGAKKLDRDSGALPAASFDSAHADQPGGSARNLHATGPPPRYAGAVRRHTLLCVFRD